MEIFGIGPGEMLLILVLALIIVGPQKLPEIGRTLGRTLGEFKAQTDAMRSLLTLDPPATPVAPPSTVTFVPAAVPADERVLALQAYTRLHPAEPAPQDDPAPSPDQELAS